jgi:hypothetical protein
MGDPVLKARLVYQRVVSWDQRPLAEAGTVVAGLRIGDDLAWITLEAQAGPDQVIETELLGSGNLHCAVERIAGSDAGDLVGDVAGGHRLDERG